MKGILLNNAGLYEMLRAQAALPEPVNKPTILRNFGGRPMHSAIPRALNRPPRAALNYFIDFTCATN